MIKICNTIFRFKDVFTRRSSMTKTVTIHNVASNKNSVTRCIGPRTAAVNISTDSSTYEINMICSAKVSILAYLLKVLSVI